MQSNLSKAQDKMKKTFDRKTRIQKFQEVDKVLLLLPNREKISRTLYCSIENRMNYEINTPKRRKKTQVCHVNRIKNLWISRSILMMKSEDGGEGKDDLKEGNKAGENPPVKLENLAILNNSENKLAHQEKPKREEVESLITKYKGLFF